MRLLSRLLVLTFVAAVVRVLFGKADGATRRPPASCRRLAKNLTARGLLVRSASQAPRTDHLGRARVAAVPDLRVDNEEPDDPQNPRVQRRIRRANRSRAVVVLLLVSLMAVGLLPRLMLGANPFVTDGKLRTYVRRTAAKIAAAVTPLGAGELMVDELGNIYGGNGTTAQNLLSRAARLSEVALLTLGVPVLWVTDGASGNDANDGLTPGRAKRTVASALTAMAALPSGTGVLQLAGRSFSTACLVRPAGCWIVGLDKAITQLTLNAGSNANAIQDARWGDATTVDDGGGVADLAINGNKANQTHVRAQVWLTATATISSTPTTLYVHDGTAFNAHGYTSGTIWLGMHRCNFTGLTYSGTPFDPSNPTTTGWTFTGVTSTDGAAHTYYPEATVLPGASWGHGIAIQSSRAVVRDVLVMNPMNSGVAYQGSNGFGGQPAYENKLKNVRVQQANGWDFEINPGATDGMGEQLVGGDGAKGSMLIMAANWEISQYHPSGIFQTGWNARNAPFMVRICAPMVRIDGHYDLPAFGLICIDQAWCQQALYGLRLTGDVYENHAGVASSGAANAISFYGQPDPGSLAVRDLRIDMSLRSRFLHAIVYQPTTEVVLITGASFVSSATVAAKLQVLSALPFSGLGSAIAGTLQVLPQSGTTIDTLSYTGKQAWAAGVALASAVGDTSLAVDDVSGFDAGGGTATIYPQDTTEAAVASLYVTYTSVDAVNKKLLGIPPSGTGSLTQALPLGTGVAQQFLTGVKSTGAGGVSIPDGTNIMQAGGTTSRRPGTVRGVANLNIAYHRRNGSVIFPGGLAGQLIRLTGVNLDNPNPFFGQVTIAVGTTSASVAHNLSAAPLAGFYGVSGQTQGAATAPIVTVDATNITVTVAASVSGTALKYNVWGQNSPI